MLRNKRKDDDTAQKATDKLLEDDPTTIKSPIEGNLNWLVVGDRSKKNKISNTSASALDLGAIIRNNIKISKIQREQIKLEAKKERISNKKKKFNK
ncbi:MAG: hypothetical protein HRS57_02595 [Mycoplasmataceae bacterium]|nr:hypothetical protein [Mycoplasmataceae bacterium]